MSKIDRLSIKYSYFVGAYTEAFVASKDALHFTYLCEGTNGKKNYTKNIAYFLFKESRLKEVNSDFLISTLKLSKRNNVGLIQIDVFLFEKPVYHFRISCIYAANSYLLRLKPNEFAKTVSTVTGIWETVEFLVNARLEYDLLNLDELRAESDISEIFGLNRRFVADVSVTFHSKNLPSNIF